LGTVGDSHNAVHLRFQIDIIARPGEGFLESHGTVRLESEVHENIEAMVEVKILPSNPKRPEGRRKVISAVPATSNFEPDIVDHARPRKNPPEGVTD
jgi:hypothetical protein